MYNGSANWETWTVASVSDNDCYDQKMEWLAEQEATIEEDQAYWFFMGVMEPHVVASNNDWTKGDEDKVDWAEIAIDWESDRVQAN